MKIHVGKLGSEPFEWQETVSIPASELERTQLLELGDISWQGEVWVESPGFRLRFSYSYEQTVACDRCLTPLIQPMTGEIDLRLVANAPQLPDDEIELTAEDLETQYMEGEEFDPEEALREQLQLNIPMRSVCREDCKGLCPNCGINRNLESCSCDEARIDPRWEALRGLRDEN